MFRIQSSENQQKFLPLCRTCLEYLEGLHNTWFLSHILNYVVILGDTCVRIEYRFLNITLRWPENYIGNRFLNMNTTSRSRDGCWSFISWNIISLFLQWRVKTLGSSNETNWFTRHHFNFINRWWRRPMQGLVVNQLLLGRERIC